MDAPMEGASVPGAVGSEVDAGQLDRELKQLVADVEATGREWGVRPDSREGRFIAALLGTVGWLGRLGAASRASFETIARENRKAVEAELAQARELRGAADAALRQVRNAQATLVVEHESVTLRMIQETLPMFAERLQNVLVIREQRWNADVRRKRYALAGAVVLGVFLAGYGLASWQDSGPVDAFGRCLEHPLQYDKHFYCSIDGLFLPPSSPVR
jgi:hypothetical protein